MAMTSDIKFIKRATGCSIGKLYVDIPYSSEEDAIFDCNSYNFHLYPEDVELRKNISVEVGVIRKRIISNLESKKDKDVKVRMIKRINFDNQCYKTDDNIIYISEGGGSGGKLANGLFKYIVARKNGVQYTLNFMRFFIDKDNNVNCILKSFQFDRSFGGNLNRESDICYPKSYRDQDNEKLKKLSRVNEKKNFCFNPKIKIKDWSNVNEFELQNITDEFIKFINEVDSKVYIVSKRVLDDEIDNGYYVKLNREDSELEIYQRVDEKHLWNNYPIRENFDASNYVMFECVKSFSCIFGGEKDIRTPAGIFNIKKVSSSEYISQYHPKFEFVKFFGYLVVFEDYYIHSDLYSMDVNIDDFREKESISLDDEHTSGCIRVLQDDLYWLIENIREGTTIEM